MFNIVVLSFKMINEVVVIVGLGYVGLLLVVWIVEFYENVIGFDLFEGCVVELNLGIDLIFEVENDCL